MKCKVCQTPTKIIQHKQLSMITPHGYPLDGELSLSLCEICGFVSNISSSCQSDYERYYTNFNKHQVRSPESIDWDFEYFSNLIRFMESSTGTSLEGTRILDYGSGTRQFSTQALDAGAEIAHNLDVGVELDPALYDWVVSTHCFEHLPNPLGDLRQLVGVLKIDGYVCIAVPNLSRYADTYYGPWSNFDLEHINHFHFESLSRVMQESGLRVEAHRVVDRLVGPTLAYPEVLVIARKTESTGPQRSLPATFDSGLLLDELFEKYTDDVSRILDCIDSLQSSTSSASDEKDVLFGFYGLSSYAFRVIQILQIERPEFKITFFADSDERLCGLELLNANILNFTQYQSFVASMRQEGYQVVTLVAAINGYRVLDMLAQATSSIDSTVIMLPPDCQNRR
jgi:hypothetical protein